METNLTKGACCTPTRVIAQLFARQHIDGTLKTTGVEAKVTSITATAAYGNSTVSDILKTLKNLSYESEK